MIAVMMFLWLLVFATGLAVVLSCYREDEPAAVLGGIRRRALTFTGAVLVFAVLAWVVSSTILYPA